MRVARLILFCSILVSLISSVTYVVFVIFVASWTHGNIVIGSTPCLSLVYAFLGFWLISTQFQGFMNSQLLLLPHAVKPCWLLKIAVRTLLIPMITISLTLSCLASYNILYFGTLGASFAIALTGHIESAEKAFKLAKDFAGHSRPLSFRELSISCVATGTKSPILLSELSEKESLVSKVYGTNSIERSTIIRMKESFFHKSGDFVNALRCEKEANRLLACQPPIKAYDEWSDLPFYPGEPNSRMINHLLSFVLVLFVCCVNLRTILRGGPDHSVPLL